ncbi:MAG: FAD-dependent oxidoreductase [Gammaproteobacteria bacterium]|nr:FAD-dependent oxidoreductase [Gammaproteobacteria bacterium]
MGISRKDRQLGMDADITRRDFLGGVGVAIGSSFLPNAANAAGPGAQDVPGYYPPARQGMRGSHPGSFEAGHMARDGGSFEGEDSGESYDLVVVGGGISGLAAAWYYRQAAGANARILVLDNHDDFGGHAKRNEWTIDDRNIIGYGGTMFIEEPAGYPANARKLIRDLGIETKRYSEFVNNDLYSSLDSGLFFDKETFGADHLAIGRMTDPSTLQNAPLSGKAKVDLVRLFEDKDHYLHDVPAAEREDLLKRIDYQSYLRDYAQVDEQVLAIMLPRPRGVWAVNSDAFPAWNATFDGYPGFGGLSFASDSEEAPVEEDHEEPRIFHFPDGNATVARMLVRKLVPAAASGDDMEDIVTARFDYSKLDDSRSKSRIRLNSTVVRARHRKDKLSNPVTVTYVRDGKAYNVEAAKVVMACYNALIPRFCPEMPAEQKTALSNCIRAPLVYTNVLIRDWTSFAKLGISGASSPGCYHHRARMDFPVSIGDYEFSRSPDEPMVLHLTRVPGEPGNPSAREQFNAGKRDLLSASFETFERHVRHDLNRILGDGDFDAARDIAGITVNRWPHGYAYTHDPETDQIAWAPETWPGGMRHWETGSKLFGNIGIAGTDAASNAMTEAAIEQAWRAIGELG